MGLVGLPSVLRVITIASKFLGCIEWCNYKYYL